MLHAPAAAALWDLAALVRAFSQERLVTSHTDEPFLVLCNIYPMWF